MATSFTSIAVPSSDRCYPQIFLIPLSMGKSGDKGERFASSDWFCTLRYGEISYFQFK
jgi:hypothetical protein